VVLEQRVDKAQVLYFEPNDIVMFDSYCVHQPVEATENGARGFFRIIYASRPYDRTGNSYNQLFTKDYLR
jgi:hypothetical protein